MALFLNSYDLENGGPYTQETLSWLRQTSTFDFALESLREVA